MELFADIIIRSVDVLTIIKDLSGGRLIEPQQRSCKRALPASRFTDDPEALPAPDLEIDILQSLELHIFFRSAYRKFLSYIRKPKHDIVIHKHHPLSA